jgi:hypothetical protein
MYMSRKYRKLTEYLKGLSDPDIQLTFTQIEEILGFTLPVSANQYQAWWSNNPRSQSLGWLEAGWRTANLDLAEERVTFIRGRGGTEGSKDDSTHLTIAEAKLGLAAALGVEPSQVEITIRA